MAFFFSEEDNAILGSWVMKIKVEDIEKLAAALRKKPKIEKKVPEVTKREAIQVLEKEITLLRNRNYSLEQIAKMLTDGGLPIATNTLKSYLGHAKEKPAAREDKIARNPRKKTPSKASATQAEFSSMSSKGTEAKERGFEVTPDDPEI